MALASGHHAGVSVSCEIVSTRASGRPRSVRRAALRAAPRRSRHARRNRYRSASVPVTPTSGAPSIQVFVRGAGEPRGPATIVSDRVFRPFGAHSTLDRQWCGFRLRLKGGPTLCRSPTRADEACGNGHNPGRGNDPDRTLSELVPSDRTGRSRLARISHVRGLWSLALSENSLAVVAIRSRNKLHIPLPGR
jgi:hypothetical protein